MKWKIRRVVEKGMLFLVSVKPIRWFFDQLIKFGKWAGKNPIMRKIWQWYKKSFKPFWISYLGYSLIVDAWHRIPYNVFIDIICLLLVIFLPNIDGDDDNDNDKDEPNDPSPTGDTVDRWLREQQKVGA